MAVKSENLYSNYVLQLFKQKMTLKFMEIKSNEPKLTQNQISNQLGFSDSTIKWYRDNNHMDRSYNGKKTGRKKINQFLQFLKPKLIQQIKSPKRLRKTTKNNKGKVLKGCDPSNFHMNGKKLIEQAFSNSSVEKNQEDNTKFITLARRMVDNV